MTPKTSKKEFSWEKGAKLTPESYDPLGNVRKRGFAKLSYAIYADPVKRKEARKKKLAKALKIKDGGFFTEETSSGIHDEFTPSEVSSLIHKEAKTFKGIGRFGERPAQPEDSGKIKK